MKKGLKIALAALLGFFVTLYVVLQLMLGSAAVKEKIHSAAAAFVEGDLEWADLNVSLIKTFPRIGVSIDSLSVTYPHERFSSHDGKLRKAVLLQAGRGPEKDTLLAFDRLDLRVNPYRALFGRLRLARLELDGLRAYAHKYDDQEANWDILKFGGGQSDSSKSTLLEKMWLSVGEFRLGGRPTLVFTNRADTVLARAAFDELSLSGRAKLASEGTRLRDASLTLDALQLFGRLPADTLAFGMDSLRLREYATDRYKLASGIDLLLLTSAFGRLPVPLKLCSDFGLRMGADATELDVDELDVYVAGIPLNASGSLRLCGADSTLVSARAAIRKCRLEEMLRNYADRFIDIAPSISTDGCLDAEFTAEGVLGGGLLPELTACVSLPDAHITYRPDSLSAFVNIDVDAKMSPQGVLDADIHEFNARLSGLKLDFDGDARDLTGADPRYQLSAEGFVKLDSIMRFLPASLGVSTASGKLDLALSVNTRASELKDFHFENSDIRGRFRGDRLIAGLNSDTLSTDLFSPRLDVVSNPQGFSLDLAFDSVYFNNGLNLRARARAMRNSASLTKVERRGELVPKLAVGSSNSMIFLQSGSQRLGFSGVDVGLSATKRSKARENARRRSLLDSLQREYPGVPRSELTRASSYLREADFATADVDISLDSSITRYLREWSPAGSVRAVKGFLTTPRFPLRTRFRNIALEFDNRRLRIDSLTVTSGTSNFSMRGSADGLIRALSRKTDIKADVQLASTMLNVNEIIAALDAGVEDTSIVAPQDELDENFITDELADATLDRSDMKLLVVPANLDASVRLNIDTLRYSTMKINPLSAALRMKDRTLQVNDLYADTDMGNLLLNAFYYTRSKKDISAGIDLKLKKVSAHDLISMLPQVDELMPAIRSFEGKFDCKFSATTQLDTNMNMVIPSLDGMLRISGKDLEIKEAGELKRITRLLLFKNKDIGKIDNLEVNAIIHDNKVEVFPFELGVDRYRLALRGMQGFDGSMYYHASVLRSPFLLRFGINLFGTWDKWRFRLGFAKYRNGQLPQFSKELDAVELNILKSIKDVYTSGVENVRRYNRNAITRISDRGEADSKLETDSLDADEMAANDQMSMELELLFQEQELAREVDEILASTYVDAGKLMSEYVNTTYTKAERRRMERIERREQRKAKKS